MSGVVRVDERKIAAWICTAIALAVVSQTARASWLSDITGINIDVPAGRISVGAPNPAAIPQMIQNLPRDAANFFLNPAGPPLAFAVRNAEAQASGSARPMPAQIHQLLAPFFPPDILNSVRYTTSGESGLNIASGTMEANGQIAAMTVNSIIVFRGPTEASDYGLWAHELVHVTQYRNMGIEGFAAMYAGWGAQRIEGDAYAWQNQVVRQVQAGYGGGQQWQYAGNQGQQLAWSDFHNAAMQAIQPLQCLQMNQSDAATLSIVNGCPINIVVTGGVIVGNYFPCTSPVCFVPANSGTTIVSAPPMWGRIDRVDVQYIN